MLWVWFEAADVRDVPASDAGVAFHAASIALKGDGSIVVQARRSPAQISTGAFRMPVVRIEHVYDKKVPYSPAQRAKVAAVIRELAQLTHAEAIQIDFDAPPESRAFYRTLLEDLRRELGPNLFLSMTALASWCQKDSWLSGVRVDEIVPMVFYMGQVTEPIRAMLAKGGQFGFPGCRGSIGLEIYEKDIPVRKDQRLYLWNVNSGGDLRAVLRRYQP